MALDHPADYPVCIAEIRTAITRPTFIGQGPAQGRNFEMLRRVNHPDGKVVLVAVGLEADKGGSYRVRSAYLVSAETVNERRLAGRLKTPRPA